MESIFVNFTWVGEHKRILGDASSFFIADKTHATGIVAADIELLFAIFILFFHTSTNLAHAKRVTAVFVLAAKSLVCYTFLIVRFCFHATADLANALGVAALSVVVAESLVSHTVSRPKLGESGTDKASNCDLEFHIK